MTTQATDPKDLYARYPDVDFYERPDFEEILDSDIDAAQTLATTPVSSIDALERHLEKLNGLQEMLSESYGEQHPDPRMEMRIETLVRAIEGVRSTYNGARRDPQVVASARAAAAQRYKATTGQDIGFAADTVLLGPLPCVSENLALQVLMDASRLDDSPLFLLPRWAADMVVLEMRHLWHLDDHERRMDGPVRAPSSRVELELLLAFYNTMNLQEASRAARCLCDAGA